MIVEPRYGDRSIAVGLRQAIADEGVLVRVLLFRPPGTLWVPALLFVAEAFTPSAARPAA
jgi:hypothetical protein